MTFTLLVMQMHRKHSALPSGVNRDFCKLLLFIIIKGKKNGEGA